MTYEDKVIDAAKKGLAEGFTTMTPEMEKLFRIIYRAGYDEALRNVKMMEVFND